MHSNCVVGERGTTSVPVLECDATRAMQMRKAAVATFAALLCMWPPSASVNAAGPDFSGRYTLTVKKNAGKSAKDVSTTIHVIENASSIEITRNIGGRQFSNIYPLSGSAGKYVAEGGQVGTCRARFKGNKMILESVVKVIVQPGLPAYEVHTSKQWELSRDMKTLKIRTAVDFPGSPLGAYSPIDPSTDLYARN